MSANQALEKLNVLKRIIERLNSEMIILISAAAEVEIIIKKNEAGISKYPLLENKVNSLIENYKSLIK
jgi:response regulator of citrate/malate metabolism